MHQLGAIGVMGALAACVVLVATAPDASGSVAGFAATRQGIAAVSRWLLVPSMLLVLVSGLLAMAINRAYLDARWAWVKAATGVILFEATLMNIDGTARAAADWSSRAARGEATEAVVMAELARTEWLGLWTLLALCLANVALAVWRPRLRRKSDPDA